MSSLKDENIVLLKTAMRFGPGEIKKIIDDAIARKGRNPLEEYYLFVKELKRLSPDRDY